jgi:hypothetical protein
VIFGLEVTAFTRAARILPKGFALRGREFDKEKGGVSVGIVVPAGTRTYVLLSTLDVRQIQRTVLGRW